MKLTLFGHYLSSSTERVRIAFALKGIDFDYVSVRDIGWDEYLRISDVRLMPAMQVDQATITQTNAILHFLEEMWPAPVLLPADPITRAQARAFGQHISGDIHPLDVRRVRRFLSNELEVSSSGIARWQKHWSDVGFGDLEALLQARESQTPFAFGEEPGWADLHLIPHMRKYVTRFGLEREKYPLISEVYSRCIDLPAFVDAAPSSQPDFPGFIEEPEV